MSIYGHQLFLEIPHTNNPLIFRVVDTSIYTDLIPVTCPLVQITSPGFNTSQDIQLEDDTKNFSLSLNTCGLGLQVADCGSSSQIIPDGVYYIRFSVSPNDKVYVEYAHLRVTQFINKYNQKLCTLEMAACDPPADVKEQLKELRLIKSFVDAAKVKVEECHQIDEGMELFQYAQKRLSKLDGNYC